MAMRPSQVSFDLVDQHGNRFTQDNFDGRSSLVYFGFLHCRVVCPRALEKLSAVTQMLGSRAARFNVLFISVDPDRDTPAAMKAFLEARYPTFIGLTGNESAVSEAKAAFRVFVRRVPDSSAPDGYVLPHTSLVYLISPEATYIAHFAEHVAAQTIAQRLLADA